MPQYDLGTQYDSRASFYGKARVNVEGSVAQLVSYSTTVAEITTLRHIKEFLKQNGFRADNSKQIMADYGGEFSDRQESDGLTHLHTVAGVMALGDIFGHDQKESNDWKARMLKAGLEGRGLIMPEDWDQLTEDQKEARLNGAIEQLS
jgi:hypothetical protein